MKKSISVELSIRIGKAIREPEAIESVRLLKTLSKLDIDISTIPTDDTGVSYDLTQIVIYPDYKAAIDFMVSKRNTILEAKARWEGPIVFMEIELVKNFIRGFLYIYPYSFVTDCDHSFIKEMGLPGINTLEQLLAWNGEVYEQIES